MNRKVEILRTEYCYEFDDKRKNAMVTSYDKYGPMAENYRGPDRNVDPIASLKMRLQKYEETGNLDYLIDVANFAMIEFMYPKQGSYYRSTTAEESPGLAGLSVSEAKRFAEEHMYEN